MKSHSLLELDPKVTVTCFYLIYTPCLQIKTLDLLFSTLHFNFYLISISWLKKFLFSELFVKAGVLNLRRLNAIEVKVIKTFEHPEYVAPQVYFDVSLVVIEKVKETKCHRRWLLTVAESARPQFHFCDPRPQWQFSLAKLPSELELSVCSFICSISSRVIN